ncbi:hypothetical protein C1646_762463 [Rhizophagus diaphanus]|nr:hypothetical protein C1646_762463 [Rhizophagus diaphanus] [Rhizophagus sp. MUCL 43196]
MSKQLFEKILEFDTNEYLENDLANIDFNCNISIDMINDPKYISKKIVNLLGKSDGYYYIYKDSYTSKKTSDVITFQYKCSQCKSLVKRPRKHEFVKNQRDRIPIERFNCNGSIKIKFKMGINIVDIYQILEYDNFNLTQKQVHAWWSILIKQEYIRDDKNQLDSAEILLNKYGYKTLINEESMQNPSNSNEDNILNNITNLINNESTQLKIINPTSDDDDDQMQLFKDYMQSIKNIRITRKYW